MCEHKQVCRMFGNVLTFQNILNVLCQIPKYPKRKKPQRQPAIGVIWGGGLNMRCGTTSLKTPKDHGCNLFFQSSDYTSIGDLLSPLAISSVRHYVQLYPASLIPKAGRDAENELAQLACIDRYVYKLYIRTQSIHPE